MLEHLLEYEDCDVDPQNKMTKSTPLHLAVGLKEPETRKFMVESLLEAGADNKCAFSSPFAANDPNLLVGSRINLGADR